MQTLRKFWKNGNPYANNYFQFELESWFMDNILTEDLDEEVLKRMPLWFRRLKEEYTRRKLSPFE